MSIDSTDKRRRSFDQMVELYARARPAPPPELFDALAAYVPPPADVLEIGCGPGNASLPCSSAVSGSTRWSSARTLRHSRDTG